MSPDYLAGFFDGEGCINIWEQQGILYVRVLIRHTFPPVLEIFKDNFGGSVRSVKGSTLSKKQVYQWQLSERLEVARFLLFMEPKLLEKKAQATRALGVLAMKYGG